MIQFIHIGKCGGTSIKGMLRHSRIEYISAHLQRPFLDIDKQMLIAVRNPIDRFCSAFYWRKKKVEWRQTNRFRGEKEFLDKHQDINSLIKNLDQLETNYVHHLNEGFEWYLKDLVKVITPESLKGIIFLKSLRSDFEKIFDAYVPDVWINKNKQNYKLTEWERRTLREYLKPDYKVLEDLFNKTDTTDDKIKEILK